MTRLWFAVVVSAFACGHSAASPPAVGMFTAAPVRLDAPVTRDAPGTETQIHPSDVNGEKPKIPEPLNAIAMTTDKARGEIEFAYSCSG